MLRFSLPPVCSVVCNDAYFCSQGVSFLVLCRIYLDVPPIGVVTAQ